MLEVHAHACNATQCTAAQQHSSGSTRVAGVPLLAAPGCWAGGRAHLLCPGVRVDVALLRVVHQVQRPAAQGLSRLLLQCQHLCMQHSDAEVLS